MSLSKNCELDGAVLGGCDDKAAGNCDVSSCSRKTAVRTAYQRAGSVFNQEVREGFGIGRTYDAGDGDVGILVSVLVVIKINNIHDVWSSGRLFCKLVRLKLRSVDDGVFRQ